MGPSLSATGKTISVFQRRSRKCFQVKRQCFYVAGSNLRPLKPMPSSRWGIGRFYLSESKCTVSARFLHGFKTCRGCKSLQNRTKGAETRSSKLAMYRKETTLKRNFQKLRESPGVRYESVGRGFESLPSHQEKPVHVVYWFFFLSAQWKGLEQGGGAQSRKQSAQWAVA